MPIIDIIIAVAVVLSVIVGFARGFEVYDEDRGGLAGRALQAKYDAGEDARLCVEAGVDVIWVSNHGGRQLDHTRACIDALPEVAAAVDGRVPVVVDGGFLRGADVVKGLCLGADVVAMGRFEGLAMAAGGAPALVKALTIIEQEIRTSMALMGVNRISEITARLLEPASG